MPTTTATDFERHIATLRGALIRLNQPHLPATMSSEHIALLYPPVDPHQALIDILHALDMAGKTLPKTLATHDADDVSAINVLATTSGSFGLYMKLGVTIARSPLRHTRGGTLLTYALMLQTDWAQCKERIIVDAANHNRALNIAIPIVCQEITLLLDYLRA